MLDNPLQQASSPGLVARNLVVAYGRGDTVLHNVSFQAKPGRITALLGPNGSGKSTSIHALLELVPCAAGEVLLDDRPIGPQLNQFVGFCADDLPLPVLLTGREYIEFCLDLRGLKVKREQTDELFAALRLLQAADRLISGYSHGMKRKLQLIANVIHRPKLLILDEPFRGLDPETAAVLRRLLVGYANNGAIVLVSTHDLAVTQSLCDDVVILGDGVVLASSAVADVLLEGRYASLEDAFLDITGLEAEVGDSAFSFLNAVGASGSGQSND